jgi:hypothetical protein
MTRSSGAATKREHLAEKMGQKNSAVRGTQQKLTEATEADDGEAMGETDKIKGGGGEAEAGNFNHG